ncbi:hypothetical protein ACFQJD_04140 [Haloplanus sp. GCM10025708]|uniref:hypothetical protein n=1 Tax=Haloferacaceae TaxID=1644056 RepID=UPI0036214816
MIDSNVRDELAAKHERDRERRLQAVKSWARRIRETPPEEWGAEQNAVVNAQLDAARDVNLSAEHRRHVRDVAAELAELSDDE